MNFVRIGFAVAGFALAIVSIALNNEWLGWAAIALLLVSLLARLILRRRADSASNRADSGGNSTM